MTGLDFRARAEIVVADVLDAPFPPSPRCLDVLRPDLSSIIRESPPTNCESLIAKLAAVRGVAKEHVLVSSGSSSLMFSLLPRLVGSGSRVLTLFPTYSEYGHVFRVLCDIPEGNIRFIDPEAADVRQTLERELASGGYDLAVLVNPNSPTGTLMDLRPLVRATLPETVLWVDETYIDYCQGSTVEGLVAEIPNLLVCKTMSKSHALSGVRIAYITGQRCQQLRKWIPPWSVGLAGQLVAIAALGDPDYYNEQYERIAAERQWLVQQLRAAGGHVRDGVANFIRLMVKEGAAADIVERCERNHGVFLRVLNDDRKLACIRIAVRQRPENERIVAALKAENR